MLTATSGTRAEHATQRFGTGEHFGSARVRVAGCSGIWTKPSRTCVDDAASAPELACVSAGEFRWACCGLGFVFQWSLFQDC